MGVSAGGLICGALIYAGQKNASETTDITRQNENFYLENEGNVSYYLSIYSLKKICTEIVPLWPKNRNQRFHTGGLMRGGLI